MFRISNKCLVLFAVVALVCLTAGIATAAPVTQSITYQGKLTNAAGSPLTGTYSVTFKLYDASTGGTVLSTDTHSVTATNGLFTTSITITDPTLVDGRALWLGIKVGTDAEMTPRQEIRPVPYALGLRPWVSGASFTTNQAGTSWNNLLPGVNVSTSNRWNPGVLINTTGTGSYGISVVTIGSVSKGVTVQTSGTGSSGVEIQTSGTNSYGVIGSTSGVQSNGVVGFTTGTGSNGVVAITSGNYANGVIAETTGNYTRGVYVDTTGIGSPAVYGHSAQDIGVYGEGKEGGYFTTSTAGTSSTPLAGVHTATTGATYNPGVLVTTTGTSSPGLSASTGGTGSPGVLARTGSDNSQGVLAQTTGDSSYGIDSYTSGQNSKGVVAYTSGYDSDGVQATTTGQYSDGIYAFTTGYGSAGVSARAYGLYSQGVYAYSEQSRALEGDTNNVNHEWGVYTPDYISALGYKTNSGDVAEFMPVTEDVTPGNVLVIGKGGVLQPSATAYDTHVAGIVSTEPGVFLGKKEAGNPGEVLIAIAGKVPCKVDASNGPIEEGDLLTTSDRPGYAMRAEPMMISGRGFYPDGTILGKAMGTLESGTGTIEVLVTLQ